MLKKEILKTSTKIKKEGLTIIPTMVYWSGRKIKVEIGLAKGKNYMIREKV